MTLSWSIICNSPISVAADNYSVLSTTWIASSGVEQRLAFRSEIAQKISVTQHGRHITVMTSYRQLGCLFNSVFMCSAKKTLPTLKEINSTVTAWWSPPPPTPLPPLPPPLPPYPHPHPPHHQMETFSALLAICAGNSPHKGQWRGALMFSFICNWINGWANNREVGDLRRIAPIMASL